MASYEFELTPAPTDERGYELWLQHCIGFILFEDVRGYARERIAPDLPPEARAAAEKGIDDALYGLMMVLDGVSGTLANRAEQVKLKVLATHLRGDEPLGEIDLFEGDGRCMGYHGWLEGDFGDDPIATPRSRG
jgi:hypothetical protein